LALSSTGLVERRGRSSGLSPRARHTNLLWSM
jgi:hypothetical protein